MTLQLDERECAALYEALDHYLPQLRFEAARSEDREVIHHLAVLEDALTRLRGRLLAEQEKEADYFRVPSRW